MIIECYARFSLQGDAKNVSMFQNIRLFLSRRGHYIGRKHHIPSPLVPPETKCFLLTLRPRRDFGLRRDFPFYRYVVPGGTKNEYYIFTSHLGDR